MNTYYAISLGFGGPNFIIDSFMDSRIPGVEKGMTLSGYFGPSWKSPVLFSSPPDTASPEEIVIAILDEYEEAIRSAHQFGASRVAISIVYYVRIASGSMGGVALEKGTLQKLSSMGLDLEVCMSFALNDHLNRG
jgi:hypothetical protein